MKPEKKIELQAKMIRELQDKLSEVTQENEELKLKLQLNEELVAQAEKYREEHIQCVKALTEAKDKYYAALSDLQKERKNYKKEMNGFFRGLKKAGLKPTE